MEAAWLLALVDCAVPCRGVDPNGYPIIFGLFIVGTSPVEVLQEGGLETEQPLAPPTKPMGSADMAAGIPAARQKFPAQPTTTAQKMAPPAVQQALPAAAVAPESQNTSPGAANPEADKTNITAPAQRSHESQEALAEAATNEAAKTNITAPSRRPDEPQEAAKQPQTVVPAAPAQKMAPPAVQQALPPQAAAPKSPKAVTVKQAPCSGAPQPVCAATALQHALPAEAIPRSEHKSDKAAAAPAKEIVAEATAPPSAATEPCAAQQLALVPVCTSQPEADRLQNSSAQQLVVIESQTQTAAEAEQPPSAQKIAPAAVQQALPPQPTPGIPDFPGQSNPTQVVTTNSPAPPHAATCNQQGALAAAPQQNNGSDAIYQHLLDKIAYLEACLNENKRAASAVPETPPPKHHRASPASKAASSKSRLRGLNSICADAPSEEESQDYDVGDEDSNIVVSPDGTIVPGLFSIKFFCLCSHTGSLYMERLILPGQ